MKSQRIDWFVLDQLWNNIYSYIPAAGRFDSFSTRPACISNLHRRKSFFSIVCNGIAARI